MLQDAPRVRSLRPCEHEHTCLNAEREYAAHSSYTTVGNRVGFSRNWRRLTSTKCEHHKAKLMAGCSEYSHYELASVVKPTLLTTAEGGMWQRLNPQCSKIVLNGFSLPGKLLERQNIRTILTNGPTDSNSRTAQNAARERFKRTQSRRALKASTVKSQYCDVS